MTVDLSQSRSMASLPGMLFVTFQPEPSFPLSRFHDWYNNEHAPARLRLPSFQNGFRYRSRNDAEPGWMVTYQVGEVSALTNPPYTTLREPIVKTERETDTMKHVEVKRGIYQRVYAKQRWEIAARESGAVVLELGLEVLAGHNAAFNEWFEVKHMPLLTQIPGWLRSRKYVVDPAGSHHSSIIILHEFEGENGVERPSSQAVFAFPNFVQRKCEPRLWELIYTYGPAPRDLGPLHDSSTEPFQSRDGRTLTWPVAGEVPGSFYKESSHGDKWPHAKPDWPAIRSYITTQDGLDLPYQLEGSGDLDAPLIVLVNPIAVDYRIWDAFVAHFLSSPANKHFRILRYNSRDSFINTGSVPVTLDLLVSDLIDLLDAFNVQHAVTAIGVGLGSITVLAAVQGSSSCIATCLAYDILPSAVPVDARLEQIQIMEKDDMKVAASTVVVGDQPAELTTTYGLPQRDKSYLRLVEECAKMEKLVRTRPWEKFEKTVSVVDGHHVQVLMSRGTAKDSAVICESYGKKNHVAQHHADEAIFVSLDREVHLPMVEISAWMAKIAGDFINPLYE